ncbi:DUF4221 family protein [Belliella pelovolcani]|uniref:DUF4221 family protein n=1 Tax=Belliella pelovolcani TaxID=529505 RepID=UPI0039190DAB
MKYFILPFASLILFSCGGSSDQSSAGNYADITISMDTVVVDSGEDILMAAVRPFGIVVNKEVTTLYNWDAERTKLEIVDLDNLKLVKKVDFEKEGPNGVGVYAYQMHLLENGQLAFIGGDRKIAITDLEGQVIKRIDYNEEWMKDGLEDTGSLSIIGFSKDGSKLYCKISNFKKVNSNIIILDLENQTREKLSLDEFDKRKNFSVFWSSSDDRSMSMFGPSLELTRWNNQLLFTTNALNSIYRYNPEDGSLSQEKYNNLLTANEKTGSYINEVSNQEDIREISSKIREEITFSELQWDEENQVFYRFSYFVLPKIADEKDKYRIFISILSSDFELIGEKEVTDITPRAPGGVFVKNGQIHSYINIDDELGFVRIKVN